MSSSFKQLTYELFGLPRDGGRECFPTIDNRRHPHNTVDAHASLPWFALGTTTLTVVTPAHLMHSPNGGQGRLTGLFLILFQRFVRDDQSLPVQERDAHPAEWNPRECTSGPTGRSSRERSAVPAMTDSFFWGLVASRTNTFIPKVKDLSSELAGPMVSDLLRRRRWRCLHLGEKFHESTSHHPYHGRAGSRPSLDETRHRTELQTTT